MFKIKATAEEIRIAREFMTAVPVTFRYGDCAFPADFKGENGVFTSPDNALRCECPFETYDETAAVEWLPRFTATTDTKTQQITELYALDYVFPTDGETVVYYTRGCGAVIDAFALQTKVVDPAEPFELDSRGSAHHLPFFNLKTGSGGVMFGLGFTGKWRATFARVEGGIRVRIAMKTDVDFHLLPEETYRHIRMLTIFWQGDLQRSFNILRNHLVRNYIPKGENGEPCPPICVNSWGGMKTHNHLKYIKFIKDNDLKFDCYWMDAGWHGPDHETDEFQDCNFEDWAYNCGDWTVNRCAHPDGLNPISEAAHDAGMNLLLWFHTYTCNEGIGWHAEHPEWQADSNTTPITIGLNPRTTIPHCINLDIPEAKEWLIQRVASTLRDNGCDWYREDSGIPEIPDTPGRIGIGEMKAVQYLYEIWDALREQNPGLLIDNCGGGGSRIDLETLKRSYVLWRSDYNCHPDADPMGAQISNHGIGHFVPLADCAPPTNPGSTYTFLSGLYGSMGFGLFHVVGFGAPEKHTWMADNYPVDWHKRMLDHYQLSKPYLSGNFYPLTPCTLDRSDVMSYQFERPDLEGGIILAFFRPECTLDSFEIQPVIPAGKYRFDNPETGDSFDLECDGSTVLTLTSNMKPESVILHYYKI